MPLSFGVSADAKDSNKTCHSYAGSLGIERDYYLKDDEILKKLSLLMNHVACLVVGKTEDEAAALAKQVVAVETQLAAALDKVARRDLPSDTIQTDQLRVLPKAFLAKYFNAIGAEGIESVVITDLGYFSAGSSVE